MKVVVKEPGKGGVVCELEDIRAINKFVGNVDENGDGYNYGGGDIRDMIAPGLDMYVKENAAFNTELKANLWSPHDTHINHGNIVFAGYDENVSGGACSLTDEQVETVMQYIEKQKV